MPGGYSSTGKPLRDIICLRLVSETPIHVGQPHEHIENEDVGDADVEKGAVSNSDL